MKLAASCYNPEFPLALAFMPRFRSPPPFSLPLPDPPVPFRALWLRSPRIYRSAQEYTPANPNCWETFQIPLDVCFEFKYRGAFELGRVIRPQASTSRTSLTLLNRVSSTGRISVRLLITILSWRRRGFFGHFFPLSHTIAIDTTIFLRLSDSSPSAFGTELGSNERGNKGWI